MQTDPLAFEALRHRITTIAEEGSAVLKMVSSSPVASEANDCNVAIMDADGAAVAIGPGLSSHGIACMMATRYVRAEYTENPGVGEGDMFLTNDPYSCTPHQTCFALVTPVWWKGRVAAWVGAGIHVPDAGGPVAGQVSVGAMSVYQEATPMLPMRIVEGGRIRKDLENEFVIRSRTPQQLALDLRAMIAACERLVARVHEMFETYGVETIAATFEDMILFSQAHLSERIKQVPEGVWKATAWLDYPQGDRTDFYACQLSLRRVGDRLELDFTASSPQAPAVINCGEPGLISSVLNAVMAMLGYGLPLCPEAVLRTIKITSTPGTFVHATHPAGCSKATTAACMAIRQSINIAVSKMMSEVDGLRSRVLAGSGGYLPVIDMAGTDQRGDRFGVPLLDIALSAGYGAMPGKDGIDSAGTMGAPSSSIANVEVYEARYPILYLWRRHAMDSGGLGEYRGGRGLSLAFTPTTSHGPLDVVLHGHGCAVPSTPGLSGGLPGGTNTFAIWRGTGVLDDPSHGLPQSEAEFHGSSAPVPGLHQTILAEGDIVLAYNNGGGGLGDPIAREPRDVLIDVISSAVSVEWAQRGYGVVVRDQQVDEQATHTLRAEMRQRRKEAGTAADVGVDDGQIGVSRGTCPTCRAKPGAWTPLFRSAALQSLGPLVTPHREDQQFRAVEVVCSTCGALLDVSVIEHEDVQVRRHD